MRATGWPFLLCLAILGGTYVVLIVALLAADAAYTTPDHIARSLASPQIRYAVKLSLVSCSITAILSLWVAVPLGYLLSRFQFPGKWLVDALLDVPVVLPPLVVGLSLLILFQTAPGRALSQTVPVAFAVPGVIVAQFAVSAAFAARTLRATFAQIPLRREQVAWTLGCTRSQAFWWVVMPEARGGVVTAGTLAWARALGEFGPILVFCGATPLRTEVLPTAVFLELSVGNLEAAVAVSLVMVLASAVVLVVVRLFGERTAA